MCMILINSLRLPALGGACELPPAAPQSVEGSQTPAFTLNDAFLASPGLSPPAALGGLMTRVRFSGLVLLTRVFRHKGVLSLTRHFRHGSWRLSRAVVGERVGLARVAKVSG